MYAGGSIEARDMRGRTALHAQARRRGFAGMVRILEQAGAR